MPVVHHASYGGGIIGAEAVLPQLEEVHEHPLETRSRVVEIPGTNHYTITLSEVFTRVVLAHLAAGE